MFRPCGTAIFQNDRSPAFHELAAAATKRDTVTAERRAYYGAASSAPSPWFYFSSRLMETQALLLSRKLAEVEETAASAYLF